MSDPVTPERWRRIEPILDAALEIPVERRAAYLDGACAGDRRLRSDVDALLVAERQAGDFLEHPGAVGAGAPAADATSPLHKTSPAVGDRVGPYVILRELGHGGMGVVYLAERADGQFEQRVALKLSRIGRAGDEVLERFLRERQILARLQHPHIARLLDGGLTADGQPYFTMEHVEGVPITRYADEYRLSVEERLRLVLAACDALEHAHAAGVVHRDLKPANLLVNDAGELKLLDFGIAKLLQGDDAAAVHTRLRPMTPEYAAPEQLRGEAVTPTSDVFGLGVVLYELLTGRHPFRDAPADTPLAVERRVLEQEPTPPSRLCRRLSGDIDAIVLGSLAKEPARRYRSPAALADDLRRHLAGRPIAARRGTATYRLRKFARRHRAELRVAILACVAFVAVASVERHTGLTRSAAPGSAAGATVSSTARRLYEEGLRAMHQQDLHGARRLLRAAVADDSLFALAIYHALRTERALALPPDRALEARLLALADGLPERERLVVRGRIAWSTADPGLLDLAERLLSGYPEEPEGHFFTGQALAARWELRRALPHLRRAVVVDSLGLHGIRADCLACDALAALVQTLTQLDSLDATERVAREWVRLQPASGRAWFALVQALEQQGDTAGALAAVRAAAPLAPANPYIPIYPALLEIRAGAFDAADRLLRQQVRAGPPDVQTEALWFLTISLRNQGRLREALATARELRQLRPEIHEPVVAEAQVLFEAGRFREAAALFDSLASLPGRGELERASSFRARSRIWHLVHHADARAAAGDTVGLDALGDRIEILGGQTLAAFHRRLHHHVRGLLLAARGNAAAASRAFRRATPHSEAHASPFSRTNLELARALLALEQPHEAISVLRPAVGWGLEAAAFYATHSELHEVLGRAYHAAGQSDSARMHFEWVLSAWQNADPELHARRDDVRRRLRAGSS